MSDRATQSRAGYEGLGSEREPVPQGRLKIRWARLAALVALVLLAFLAGRLSAPSGAPTEALERSREGLSEARAEIEDLRTELATVASPTPTESPTPAAETTPGEEETPAEEATPREDATPEGDTYVVQEGDTLQSIAEEFYEDPTLDDVIAEANGITEPTELGIGSEIIIPERPEL